MTPGDGVKGPFSAYQFIVLNRFSGSCSLVCRDIDMLHSQMISFR